MLTWFIAVSVFAVVLTVYDKVAAKAGLFRVPEAFLLLTGAAGGAFFMYVTMIIIRHKTKKRVFMLTLPLFAAIHLFAAYAVTSGLISL